MSGWITDFGEALANFMSTASQPSSVGSAKASTKTQSGRRILYRVIRYLMMNSMGDAADDLKKARVVDVKKDPRLDEVELLVTFDKWWEFAHFMNSIIGALESGSGRSVINNNRLEVAVAPAYYRCGGPNAFGVYIYIAGIK